MIVINLYKSKNSFINRLPNTSPGNPQRRVLVPRSATRKSGAQKEKQVREQPFDGIMNCIWQMFFQNFVYLCYYKSVNLFLDDPQTSRKKKHSSIFFFQLSELKSIDSRETYKEVHREKSVKIDQKQIISSRSCKSTASGLRTEAQEINKTKRRNPKGAGKEEQVNTVRYMFY